MEKLAGLISANYNDGNFGKLTSHRPIAAIPFGSRYRLMDFTLSNMVNSGITSVGLITPHIYRSLLDHIGSGKEFGLSRKVGGLYILPGSTYGFDIGNGKFSIRDISGNIKFFQRTDFGRVVLSTCNKIFNIDYREVEKYHIEKEANITFVYKKMESANVGDIVLDFDKVGNVKAIRRLKKKETNVNLFLDSLIADKSIMLKIISWYRDYSYVDVIDAIGESLGKMSVVAYNFQGYAKAINNVKDYFDASLDLLNDKVIKDLFLCGRLIHTKIHDAAPVKYFENAIVKKALVGTGSLVKGKIENSLIFRDSVIDEGAVIKNSVIMQKCYIGKNAVLENVICEKNYVINDGEIHKGTVKSPVVLSND